MKKDIFAKDNRIEELLQQLSDVTWFKKIIDNIPQDILDVALGSLNTEIDIRKKNNNVIEAALKNPYGKEEGQWHYFMASPYPGISIIGGNIEGIPMLSSIGTGLPEMRRSVFHYCIKGRCEINTRDGMYAFMEPGVLCVESRKLKEKSLNFYGEAYEGVEISFDLDVFGDEDVRYLRSLGIDIEVMRDNYDKNVEFFIGNVSQQLKDAENELDQLLRGDDPDVISLFIYILRINDLIRRGHVKTDKDKLYLTKGQRKIVSEIHDHITEHISEDITVEELTEKYNVSHVSLNKWFGVMYGDTIPKYMRNYRMKYAAKQIVNTDKSISDIAAEVAYDNQGKFSSAFKKQFGMTPLEYRRRSV